MGQPYEFHLPQEMRDAIDVTLAQGALEAIRKYLVNIGVGEPTHKERPGLSLPVGDKIKKGFKAARLIYKKPKKGVLANHIPGVLKIRHAQVLRKYQVPQSRLRLVYNSFLPENGELPPERQAHGKRGCRVLYVGNEGPAKGFDVFLRVAAELAARGVRDGMHRHDFSPSQRRSGRRTHWLSGKEI